MIYAYQIFSLKCLCFLCFQKWWRAKWHVLCDRNCCWNGETAKRCRCVPCGQDIKEQQAQHGGGPGESVSEAAGSVEMSQSFTYLWFDFLGTQGIKRVNGSLWGLSCLNDELPSIPLCSHNLITYYINC